MPKGVYPRRPRTAKPVAVAKKQAPKQPDPRLKSTVWEYMESDPEVVALTKKRAELNELRTEAKRQAVSSSHKIADYYRSIRVIQNQVDAYECSSDNEDSAVKELTGECMECVVDGFTSVIDELHEKLAMKARKLVKFSDAATELDQSIDELFKKWSAARTRARKEWEDHQAKLEKQAEVAK